MVVKTLHRICKCGGQEGTIVAVLGCYGHFLSCPLFPCLGRIVLVLPLVEHGLPFGICVMGWNTCKNYENSSVGHRLKP